MASNKGDFESAGSSLVVSGLMQLSAIQSKDPIRRFTEFVKEAMNNHTAAIINQIVISEGKITKMMEEIKDVEHIVKTGDISKVEKAERDGLQELSCFFSVPCGKTDRVFQNNDLVWEPENNQPSEPLDDDGDLPDVFILLTEKKQLNFVFQTDDYSWLCRRSNELDYTSKKIRYGGSILEEIFLKRGQFFQIYQPQTKIKNLLKIKVGWVQKDWKKYKKKIRIQD